LFYIRYEDFDDILFNSKYAFVDKRNKEDLDKFIEYTLSDKNKNKIMYQDVREGETPFYIHIIELSNL
jgi:hypothetical protein